MQIQGKTQTWNTRARKSGASRLTPKWSSSAVRNPSITARADETKTSLQGLRAHHSIAYSRVTLGFEFSEEESDRLKGAIQPLVLENPRTGRRSLYLASHASRILDRPVPDGRLLRVEKLQGKEDIPEVRELKVKVEGRWLG